MQEDCGDTAETVRKDCGDAAKTVRKEYGSSADIVIICIILTIHIILILFFRATYTLATFDILVVLVCFLQQT